MDHGHQGVNEPRWPEARAKRNKDREWTKKNGKSYYGHKLHTLTDIDCGLIRRLETTTVEIHDSQINLSQIGEVVYRDRGYFGAPSKGHKRHHETLSA